VIFQQNDISRQILLKYLVEGLCQVSFTKVKDNSNRILLCTLNPEDIPTKFSKSVTGVLGPTLDEDLLPVWDISEGKWKSFRISKVNMFRTEDELMKQDSSGPDIDSKQKTIIEERKKKAIKNFDDKILNLKNQAQKSRDNLQAAKDIINKLRNEAQQRRNTL
jgi:hypothetical protein